MEVITIFSPTGKRKACIVSTDGVNLHILSHLVSNTSCISTASPRPGLFGAPFRRSPEGKTLFPLNRYRALVQRSLVYASIDTQ